MPPRKKIVKKIVRTVRKTATSKTAAAAVGTAVPETPVAETTVSEAAVEETPVPETIPEASVSETPASVTAPETAVAAAGAIEPAGITPETAVPESAGTHATATETAESDAKPPPAKKSTTRIRKVTRRVPVRRTPNAAAAAAQKEEEGAGEATAAAAVVEEEDKHPNLVSETTSSIPGEIQHLIPNPNQSSERKNPNSDIEAGASLATGGASPATSGASPVSVGPSLITINPSPVEGPQLQGSVRKVRKVLVKRTTKVAEAAQKEEKGAAAEDGRDKEEEKKPTSKTETAISAPAEDQSFNLNQSSAPENPAAHVAATAAAAVGSLPMREVLVSAPELGNLIRENGETSEGVPMEQDKIEGSCMAGGSAGDEVTGITERQRRRKTEIFIGGLDRDAMEEDIRKVFGSVGEIVEVRLMMDGKTGKNKGYSFLRYATAAQAKQAVTEFAKVEVCGKQCGAAALEGNDTIFLGNIDKKWKKDDIIRLLRDIGIEKIDTVTVMPDPKNADCNRGFAFLELETNRDAQTAYKKLQKKDVFGKGRNIKVAWAEPLNDPDEEEMQKVKSVYADGIPSSWDDKKVRECFKKFGEIERVVLARNIQSAKRKDFAFINFKTRESALSCIELFEKEDLTDGGSKVSVKVSLAKPVQKGKQNKGGSKSGNKDYTKERPKAATRDMTVNVSSGKEQTFKGSHSYIGGDKSSTTHELLHVLREQATWKQGQIGYASGPATYDYRHSLSGGKRPLSALGDDALYADHRGYPRARLESALPVASPSYNSLSHNVAGTSLQYYQRPTDVYGTGSPHGVADPSRSLQTRQGGATYGSSLYSRY